MSGWLGLMNGQVSVMVRENGCHRHHNRNHRHHHHRHHNRNHRHHHHRHHNHNHRHLHHRHHNHNHRHHRHRHHHNHPCQPVTEFLQRKYLLSSHLTLTSSNYLTLALMSSLARLSSDMSDEGHDQDAKDELLLCLDGVFITRNKHSESRCRF